MPPPIKNVFVLMLENRSFDHMLGFSGLSGTDAATGQATQINGQSGQSNSYAGKNYQVDDMASDPMPVDPAHEFVDVVTQLCGADATYPLGGPYPDIDNSGFVAAYAYSSSPDEGNAPGEYGRIMSCQAAANIPFLSQLAKSFAVCDSWHSSVPGPTVPNRFFALAASSGGLDHSPTDPELISWETLDGFEFPNGTLFDALDKADDWRIYSDGITSLAAAIKGVHPLDVRSYSDFAADISTPNYSPRFTWVEPNYGEIGSYKGGTSQHPRDGVSGGDTLIKTTYETLRASAIWPNSLLIITWDEHGGFYDHVRPPPARPPADTTPGSKYNQYHFPFDRYGVRVPAVVISPYIPEGIIDHRLYDHSSIPKTMEAIFGLSPLTARDKSANSLLPLLSLSAPRADCPAQLPAPPPTQVAPAAVAVPAAPLPTDGPLSGNAVSFLHVAMRQDLALSPPSQKHAILTRVQAIRTREEAKLYVAQVAERVRAHRHPTQD
jgi:phospholipase C